MAVGGKDLTPDMVELTEIEGRFAALNNAFEMYFLGIEKKPPVEEWEALKKEIRRIITKPSNNTAVKFRRNSVNQRIATRNTYWERTLKEIEEGTYRRHRFKADFHAKQQRQQQAGGASPAAAASAKAAAAGARDNGGSLDSIHAAYIAARKQTGEATNIAKEQLAQVIAKQIPAIKERYKCKDVEFKVAIENGKAKLKAVPKN